MDKSTSSKMGLDGMTGVLLKVFGDLVQRTARDTEGAMWFQLRTSLDDRLRDDVHKYLRAYNAEHKTRFSASFPKAFRMRLRSEPARQKESAQRGAKGRAPRPDPLR